MKIEIEIDKGNLVIRHSKAVRYRELLEKVTQAAVACLPALGNTPSITRVQELDAAPAEPQEPAVDEVNTAVEAMPAAPLDRRLDPLAASIEQTMQQIQWVLTESGGSFIGDDALRKKLRVGTNRFKAAVHALERTGRLVVVRKAGPLFETLFQLRDTPTPQ